MGLDNCIMTFTYHDNVIQSIFTALKVLCSPLLGGAQEWSTEEPFVTSSQVMLFLWILGPHFAYKDPESFVTAGSTSLVISVPVLSVKQQLS